VTCPTQRVVIDRPGQREDLFAIVIIEANVGHQMGAAADAVVNQPAAS
jgi:hypothetical protein